MTGDELEFALPKSAARQPDHPGCEDDRGEGNPEEKDADERKGRNRPHHLVLERFAADAQDCRRDDRQHDGLQPAEDRRDRRHISKRRVEIAQSPQQTHRRKDKQAAGDDAAARAMQQPADIHRELLRLRAGQEHAVVQGVEETRLADPAPALHEFRVHERDLAGGTAK